MAEECRLCAGGVDDVLVEHVAKELWLSRRLDASDPPWAEAGSFWQDRFRELAAVAMQALRTVR